MPECPNCGAEINSLEELTTVAHKQLLRLPESESEKSEPEFDPDTGLIYAELDYRTSEERYLCPECGGDITDLIGPPGTFLKGE